MRREYYYRTSRLTAKEIIRNGFEDRSGTEETGSNIRGTWFTDSPSAVSSGFGDALIAVDLLVEVAESYFNSDDQDYREYIIPAEVLNSCPRRIVPES